IVGPKPIAGRPVDLGRHGRIVAECQSAEGRDLARAMIKAGVARHCPRFGRLDLCGRQSTIDAIRAALEGAGVIFIAANGGGVGVRMVGYGSK
ncbi:hypothetical protein M1105_18920, partial [Limibaculum sp. FT325]|uniref:hypothetical protein n=1 Tax=Thermohalobaculum sediminis TaxID=2939436 RepID=UPI0020BFA8DE